LPLPKADEPAMAIPVLSRFCSHREGALRAVSCAACHPLSTGASTRSALVVTLAMGARAAASPLRGIAGDGHCLHQREAGRHRPPSATLNGRRSGRETARTPCPIRGAGGGSPCPDGGGPLGTDSCRRGRGLWLDSPAMTGAHSPWVGTVARAAHRVPVYAVATAAVPINGTQSIRV